MSAPLIIIGYLAMHFATYCVAFRHRGTFRNERGIFLLHFVSACALPPSVGFLYASSGIEEALAVAVLAASLHGIYSLTFLELWALADGSYSYIVLRSASLRPSASTSEIVATLAATSDRKKSQRLSSVIALGLVSDRNGTVSLTKRGRLVARLLRSLQVLANISDAG